MTSRVGTEAETVISAGGWPGINAERQAGVGYAEFGKPGSCGTTGSAASILNDAVCGPIGSVSRGYIPRLQNLILLCESGAAQKQRRDENY